MQTVNRTVKGLGIPTTPVSPRLGKLVHPLALFVHVGAEWVCLAKTPQPGLGFRV